MDIYPARAAEARAIAGAQAGANIENWKKANPGATAADIARVSKILQDAAGAAGAIPQIHFE